MKHNDNNSACLMSRLGNILDSNTVKRLKLMYQIAGTSLGQWLHAALNKIVCF